ncbi:MAG: WXG100 family type VII secretion target [Chloroflexales bacterium]
MGTDILIKLARAALDNVLSQLSNQLRVVNEQALNPARQMVQAVTGGIWRGNGADAFVEEISSLMIPGVGRVADHITKISHDLTHARDVIERADEAIERLVRTRLHDAFEFY